MKTGNNMKETDTRNYGVLVLGGEGQLGSAVGRSFLGSPFGTTLLGHKDCDITEASSVNGAIETYNPDIVVNCAALTNVERIETDPEYRKIAYETNVIGPWNIARAVALHPDTIFVHISTDYIWSESWIRSTPPIPFPLNVYGHQKLEAELAIETEINQHFDPVHGSRLAIIRPSWMWGGRDDDFVWRIIQNCYICKAEGGEMKIPTDTGGYPVNCDILANSIKSLCQSWVLGVSRDPWKFCAYGTERMLSRYEWTKLIIGVWNEVSGTVGLMSFVPGEGSQNLTVGCVRHPASVMQPSDDVPNICGQTVDTMNVIAQLETYIRANLDRMLDKIELELRRKDLFDKLGGKL